MVNLHLVKKVENRFIIGDIIQLVLYNITMSLKEDNCAVVSLLVLLKIYGSSPESDTICMTEEDFIV
jgi:hypothetical protein